MESRRKQILISLILLGFSLFYLIASLKLKMGTHRVTGPGFFPLVIGGLLLVCTVVYLGRVLAQSARERDAVEPVPRAEKNYRAVAGILICTAAFPLILEYLKFVGSTFIVGFAMLLLLKPKSVLFSLLLSIAIAVGCFLIFSRLFGVSLPFGPIEELLFRIGG